MNNLQKNRGDAALTTRDTPFLRALVAATFDLAGEQRTDLCELWEQGVAYGRASEKASAYRCAADQIDSGATTRDLRDIANGIENGK